MGGVGLWTVRSGRKMITAGQYAPAPPAIATSTSPMSELVRTSSSRALSSGLTGRPKRSINCGGREEVGVVCDNRPSNPLLAAAGSLLLIIRGKVLIATLFIIATSATL